MSDGEAEVAANHEPAVEEPQAPPYVLHQDPIGSSADRIEFLPIYTEHHDPNAPLTIHEVHNILLDPNRARENDINIWRRYLAGYESRKHNEDESVYIPYYSSAIENGQEDVVAFLIENHLVTANTPMFNTTPLLKAVSVNSVRMVQQLLELGADPNGFGCISWIRDPLESILRTPLQVAASTGNLVLVKLLMEQYHCDDSLIAPDGQIALRLAAENGHREIVDYLPSRRGGGFRRWKHKNKKALQRAKKAAKGIGSFVKFFVWDIEKFFLWTVPKHVIVKPFIRCSTWAWKHRKGFVPWCQYQLGEMPKRAKSFLKWIGKAITRSAKFLWECILKVPKVLKDLVVWVWKIVTVGLPKAVALLARWVSDGLISLVKLVWNAILRVVSFLSTVVEAIVSFFRSLTLMDIWNGFCDVLQAVFVALPKLIGSWIMAFGDGAFKIMKLLLGELGEILWYIGYGIVWVATFVPRKIWVMLQSLGSAIAKAGYEVRVWLNPKAS